MKGQIYNYYCLFLLKLINFEYNQILFLLPLLFCLFYMSIIHLNLIVESFDDSIFLLL